VKIVSLALLIFTSALSAQKPFPTNPKRSLTAPFDTPLRSSIVDLGPSPYYPGLKARHNKLSCFYFSDSLVKEYDEGQKGSEWLSILPIGKGEKPDCTRSHELAEKVIDGREWTGYFKGVKGHLVFFDGDDGYNGGVPFAIFDSATGQRVFQDSTYDSRMWTRRVKTGPFDRLSVSSATGRPISLKYLRVSEAGCDLHLHTEKSACWDKVKTAFHLQTAQEPVCDGYKGISNHYSSVIAYPVEVTVSQPPDVKNIAGPIKCWPVD
jgi:hypothetical protein